VTAGGVGKGVIGTVAVGWGGWGGDVKVAVDGVSGVFTVHPAIKNTIKVNITILDEFNGIKRPFVIP
jgi:hypothetical protein